MQIAKVITLSVLAITLAAASSPALSQPRLTITESDGNVIVSWPASNGLYKLQFRPDISAAPLGRM